MVKQIKVSLTKINYRLYLALLVLGFVPTVYTTVRVFLLGQLPNEYSFSIAGQLSWVNLLYEILKEAIVLPLFFFVGEVRKNKDEFSNRIRTGLLLTLCLYGLLSLPVIIFAEPLLSMMATDPNIIGASASYIRIESVANVLSILAQFILVVLVSINKSRYLYVLTGARLVLSVVLDVFLVSNLPISAKLGVNGIGVSNILVGAILLLVSVLALKREGFGLFERKRLSFAWVGKLAKVGGISGLESLVRNLAYMLMVVRMVNAVGEQGTYWVANNFIWGWLLLPILQLGELIKQEVSSDRNNIRSNSLGYFGLTFAISVSWFVSIPLWKPFMTNVLSFSGELTDKVFELVIVLVGFYVLYGFQNVFDATFYGLGKTCYMLFESVVTNSVYYGLAFLLYAANLWTPSLFNIALLFGIGNAFDSIVSFFAYRHLLKREGIHLLQPIQNP